MTLVPLHDPLRLATYTPISPASVIVFREGNYAVAVDGKTKEVLARSTDHTEVIQKALGSLTPNRTWKETVVLMSDFEVTGIEVPSYTRLVILGKIKLKDNANATVIDTEQFATEVEIVAGIVDGNKDNQNPSGEIYGIRLNAATNSAVIGTKVINAHYDGVIVAGGFRNKVIGVHAEGCGHNGVAFWAGDRDTYRGHLGIGITARNNALEGVGLGDVNGVVLLGLQTSGNSKGVAVDGGVDIVILGHRSEGDEYGAFIAGINITYNGFKIKNSISRGIIIKAASDGALPDGIKLAVGDVEGSQGHGIDIWDSKLVEIDNVTVKGSAMHGLSVVGSQKLHEIRVRNSMFIDNGSAGIRIGATDSKISKVVLRGVVSRGNKYGVYVGDNTEMDELVIEDCDLRDNTDEAIHWYATVATKIIRRNRGFVTENSGVAVFSGDGSTTEFTVGAGHGLSVSPSDPSRLLIVCTPVSPDAMAASPLVCYPEDADADGKYETIKVKFASAPASGTNNVKVRWEAKLKEVF